MGTLRLLEAAIANAREESINRPNESIYILWDGMEFTIISESNYDTYKEMVNRPGEHICAIAVNGKLVEMEW